MNLYWVVAAQGAADGKKAAKVEAAIAQVGLFSLLDLFISSTVPSVLTPLLHSYMDT